MSSAIADLEIDLALQLFDRSKRYPQLTVAGERVLQQARLINSQCQALTEFALSLASGEECRLTLAVDDEGQLPWLAPLLAEFALVFPRLELRLLFPVLEDLTMLLRQGEADLAISYQPQSPPSDIDCWPLQAVQFVLLVAADHPLATLADTGVTSAQLQQHRQLLVTDRQQGAEKQRGRLSAEVWWLEGDIAVLALVQLSLQSGTGLGASMLPLSLELWRLRGKSAGPAAHWLQQRLLATRPS